MYYLIQVMLSIIVVTWVFYNSKGNTIINIVVIIAIFRKVGIWPLHGWYIKLISRLEIKQRSIIVVITWQKILPVILVLNIQVRETLQLIIIVIIVGTVIRSLRRLRQNFEIKKIIAISSINNNSWIILGRIVSLRCVFVFISIYSATLIITLRLLEKIREKTKSLIRNFWFNTLIVANISGLPPLALFWAKITVVKIIIKSNLPSEIALLLMISACLLIYHYLWIIINETRASPEKSQITLKTKKEKIIITIVITSRALRGVVFITSGLTKRVYLDRVKL